MNPNDYEKQVERALIRKLELIEYKGGKCEICGYDKNLSALEFHHIDPSEKEFQLDSRHLSNTSIEKLKSEINKCMLLCANCHREIHHPQLSKSIVNESVKEIKGNKIKVLATKRRQAICKFCGKSYDYVKGKLYCSKECREKDKNYPSKEEVLKKYEELKSQEKVAEFFGLTRKIIKGIIKQKNNQ